MFMMKVTLIAIMSGAKMTAPVKWTLDGKSVGNRSSVVIDVPTNDKSAAYEVCAQYKSTVRCAKFASQVGTETTLPISLD